MRDRHARGYHNRWAKRRRLELIAALGGVCSVCKGEDALEIDHVDGRDYELERLGPRRRVSRYWREYRQGVALRVLCRNCNGTDGANHREYS